MSMVVVAFAVFGFIIILDKLATGLTSLIRLRRLEKAVCSVCELFSHYSKGKILTPPSLGASKEHLKGVIRRAHEELKKGLK